MGRNQYWAGRVYDLCDYYMTGTSESSTESGFMEKPGIEPATHGLQGIVLIHYTTGASLSDCGYGQAGMSLCWLHIPHCWKSHVAAHIIYSRFSKIVKTSCMLKWPKQTKQTQICLLQNLIRLWDVCCIDNYFVNLSPDNQHFI